MVTSVLSGLYSTPEIDVYPGRRWLSRSNAPLGHLRMHPAQRAEARRRAAVHDQASAQSRRGAPKPSTSRECTANVGGRELAPQRGPALCSLTHRQPQARQEQLAMLGVPQIADASLRD
jgi:hypothetical protein